MSRESIVFLLGISTFLMPHLGVPEDFKVYFYTAAGIICMVCGYTLRRRSYLRSVKEENGERHTDSFSESVGARDRSAGTSSLSNL